MLRLVTNEAGVLVGITDGTDDTNLMYVKFVTVGSAQDVLARLQQDEFNPRLRIVSSAECTLSYYLHFVATMKSKGWSFGLWYVATDDVVNALEIGEDNEQPIVQGETDQTRRPLQSQAGYHVRHRVAGSHQESGQVA